MGGYPNRSSIDSWRVHSDAAVALRRGRLYNVAGTRKQHAGSRQSIPTPVDAVVVVVVIIVVLLHLLSSPLLDGVRGRYDLGNSSGCCCVRADAPGLRGEADGTAANDGGSRDLGGDGAADLAAG